LYESDPASFRTRNVGILAGVSQEFSETLHGMFKIGPRWTRSETASQATVCSGPIVLGICTGTLVTLGAPTSTDSSGFIGTAEVTQRWQTGQVKAGVGRELNPSGIGALIQTDAVRAQFTQDLSPRWTAQLDLGFYKSRYVGAAIEPNKSTYFRIEPRVSWHVAPNWTVEAGYSFAREKYETQPQDATANVVFMTLSYAWQKIAISR
jgi:hypothetical protein